MTREIVIDPITRIEGHLSAELTVDNGIVSAAQMRGDMFRGFEQLLGGRNPFDAIQITQRICGVCPISHGIVSSRCVESACAVTPDTNGRVMRNLMLCANYLQSHILHFYHLVAVDYIDITAVTRYTGSDARLARIKAWVLDELNTKKGTPFEIAAGAPFLPRYEGNGMYIDDDELNVAALVHYVTALEMRMKAHRIVALLGGRVPHAIGLVPGGVTQVPTAEIIGQIAALVDEISAFVNNCYLPDILAVARASPDYLRLGHDHDCCSYGEFPLSERAEDCLFPSGILAANIKSKLDPARITEHVMHSRYRSPTGLHPAEGRTDPQPEKSDAYSWIKAPRYDGTPMEVGPAARVMIGYSSGREDVVREVNALKDALGADASVLMSAMGRHAARAIECKLLCAHTPKWLDEVAIGKEPRNGCSVPGNGEGMGMGEAPRGALGHWISIRDKKIHRYQCVVPTTWNASPRDDKNVPGPMEQALVGVPIADPENPIEAVRVVRSFDPCIACAVHCARTRRTDGEANK